jgi:hypothetical protein
MVVVVGGGLPLAHLPSVASVELDSHHPEPFALASEFLPQGPAPVAYVAALRSSRLDTCVFRFPKKQKNTGEWKQSNEDIMK